MYDYENICSHRVPSVPSELRRARFTSNQRSEYTTSRLDAAVVNCILFAAIGGVTSAYDYAHSAGFSEDGVSFFSIPSNDARNRGFPHAGHAVQPEYASLVLSFSPFVYFSEDVDGGIGRQVGSCRS